MCRFALELLALERSRVKARPKSAQSGKTGTYAYPPSPDLLPHYWPADVSAFC
ncbi:hypothetical protein [Mumia zhuanghuii]|uniref:hypothetical protein n=1 Tax=Mumia zhuanghuii TaxID=2585211 RepID=UPI00129D03AA|nr:hypothetical protein [Mumia zhuanghuii]